MNDIEIFFHREPRALPLYRELEKQVLAAIPTAAVRVNRTQISFADRVVFASTWLPLRPIAGRTEVYIVVSFGLGHRLEDPRVVDAVEPYPGRWTHHVLITDPAEVDEQLLGWLSQAHTYAETM